MEIAERWFSWLQSHTDYDHLILETSNGRDYWIHISCRKNKKANRHQGKRSAKAAQIHLKRRWLLTIAFRGDVFKF